MIRKNTVLVLGAGASRHLGFPLGQGLIEEVYRLVFESSKGFRIKKNAFNSYPYSEKNSVLLARFLGLSKIKKEDNSNYTSEYIEQFAEDLHKAQVPSIDTFLAQRSQYQLLGKLCVIFCLSKYEDKDGWLYRPSSFPNKLKIDFPNFGWYQYLWHKIIDGVERLEQLKENKLTIITFNYERSLEHYLITSIKSFFGVEERDAAEVFKYIKIKHVYGKLGKFYWETNFLENSTSKTSNDIMMETAIYTPWEVRVFFRLMEEVGECGMDRRDFEKGRGVLSQQARKGIVEQFNRVAKRIKTYNEIIEEQKTKEYFNDLRCAERVYFLGFRYHDQNLKALGFHGQGIGEFDIYGTAYGLSDKEAELKKTFLASMTNPGNVKIMNKWSGLCEKNIVKSFFEQIAPLD